MWNLKIDKIPYDGIEVKIFNILGELKDAFVADDTHITYSNIDLPSGIYLMTVYHSEKSKNIKFIISK